MFLCHQKQLKLATSKNYEPLIKGQSAYNAVERRMAPLSKTLSGVILPFDTFGTHLDSNNNTIDIDLEKRNFSAAGHALAEIWSSTVSSDIIIFY